MDDTLHIILAKLNKISSWMELDQVLGELDKIKKLIEIEISISSNLQALKENFDDDDFRGSWWSRIRERCACWLVS